jgi:aminopeptidase N
MKKYLKNPITTLFIFIASFVFSQERQFTQQDTIRGSITPERIWWNLKHYDLDIAVDIENKSLKGSNTIAYEVLESNSIMQIDLQPPMKITSVTQNGKSLSYTRNGNAFYITLSEKQNIGDQNSIQVFYEGSPKVSARPPWDDGFVGEKDENGNDFVSQASQGGGSSIWWPCKDHMYDEPDNGMVIRATCPNNLTAVANGRLTDTIENDNDTKTFVWKVVNPINNYGVNINIGDYAHFSEKFDGEKGELDCDYYVLSYNLEKAKEHFKQASMTLEAFEYWFGPYPFYEDSYKLVEVSYPGMEHQSSVTYGNGFKNGFYGRSRAPGGMKFDYIIIHETGHEWFANNITYKDMADMWVHEGFTCYSENLYLDYHFGKEIGTQYVLTQRDWIGNRKPMIGPYDVNTPGADVYMKGAAILHTLRQIANNDDKWRSILRGLNKEFYHKTVTTKDVEEYISDKMEVDLKPFFDKYLRDSRLPTLKYTIKENTLSFNWTNCIVGFSMPIKVYVNGEEKWITPETRPTNLEIDKNISSFEVDTNFYISTFNNAVY